MKSVTFNADFAEYFLQCRHGCQFKIHMDNSKPLPKHIVTVADKQ
jgi:hypothetical protein